MEKIPIIHRETKCRILEYISNTDAMKNRKTNETDQNKITTILEFYI